MANNIDNMKVSNIDMKIMVFKSNLGTLLNLWLNLYESL